MQTSKLLHVLILTGGTLAAGCSSADDENPRPPPAKTETAVGQKEGTKETQQETQKGTGTQEQQQTSTSTGTQPPSQQEEGSGSHFW